MEKCKQEDQMPPAVIGPSTGFLFITIMVLVVITIGVGGLFIHKMATGGRVLSGGFNPYDSAVEMEPGYRKPRVVRRSDTGIAYFYECIEGVRYIVTFQILGTYSLQPIGKCSNKSAIKLGDFTAVF